MISENKLKQAINNCFWPGRYQIIQRRNVTYYLDGAHTPESMKSCCEWFRSKVAKSQHVKVLIFNTIGDRSSENLLKQLRSCDFDHVYFVPNVAVENRSKGKTFGRTYKNH